MTVLPVAQTDRLYVKITFGQTGQFKVGYFDADYVAQLDMVNMGMRSSPDNVQPIVLGYEQEIYYADIQQTYRLHHDFVWGNAGFSTNGEWMVGAVARASSSGYCTSINEADRYCDIGDYTNIYVRIRLSDFAVGGFSTTEGKQVSGLTLSITNDGEAAAVTGYGYWKLDLYTFPSGTPLDTNQLRVGDVSPSVLDDPVVGGQYVSNAFFSNDDQYLYYNVRHSNRTDLMRMWPNSGAQPVNIDNYLALGDSFSSGEGEYDYRPETNFYHSAGDNNLCHQSTLSYGYLISTIVSPSQFGSVACSGAKMRDVSYTERGDYWNNKPQAKGIEISPTGGSGLDRVLAGFLPGYLDQNTVVNYAKPSVATISVGGNDVGFSDIVKACVINKYLNIKQTCYDKRDEREVLANSVDGQIKTLSQTFQNVRASMSGDKRLYVVGYPQAISPSFTLRCDVGTPVVWSEREFLANFTDYLNEAVRIAAENAGAIFVDNSNAFIDGSKDYRLCGNQGESAMNDIERNTKSVRPPGQPVSKESFHPTLLGHILMTRQIRQQTNDLMRPMPDPLPSDEWGETVGDYYREQLVGDTEKKTDKKATPQENIAPNTLYKKGKKNLLKIFQYFASGNARAVLYSDPVDLGSLQVGLDGTISGDVVIPEDVPTGYHQLHVIYTTADGEEKDVYQYVFVGESPDDLDGDGIADAQEPCMFSAPDGLDMNGDGVVNGCLLGATDTLDDSGSLPGNNLDTLISSGAITPAEAAIARAAKSGRKVATTSATPSDQTSEKIVTMQHTTDAFADKAAAHLQQVSPRPKPSSQSSRFWRLIGVLIIVVSIVAVAIRLYRHPKR